MNTEISRLSDRLGLKLKVLISKFSLSRNVLLSPFLHKYSNNKAKIHKPISKI